MTPEWMVFDDVLADPAAYRAAALAQSFGDVELGGQTFRGIARAPADLLADALGSLLPEMTPGLTFLRRSPAGQAEPNYIHSDEGMGSATGILYLNPTPPPFDGTTFWRRPNGERSGPWTPEVEDEARRESDWSPWRRIGAMFNRLLVFKSDLFHSRTLKNNYGTGDGARLIQVVFFQ